MEKEKRKILRKIKSTTGCDLISCSTAYRKFPDDFQKACEKAKEIQNSKKEDVSLNINDFSVIDKINEMNSEKRVRID